MTVLRDGRGGAELVAVMTAGGRVEVEAFGDRGDVGGDICFFAFEFEFEASRSLCSLRCRSLPPPPPTPARPANLRHPRHSEPLRASPTPHLTADTRRAAIGKQNTKSGGLHLGVSPTCG